MRLKSIALMDKSKRQSNSDQIHLGPVHVDKTPGGYTVLAVSGAVAARAFYVDVVKPIVRWARERRDANNPDQLGVNAADNGKRAIAKAQQQGKGATINTLSQRKAKTIA